ncbi:hypothetical protein EVAR_90248_1 [Eumeta japonica]|uniref:Uncharacterized protein n=1 Tax=Eumeta variegata TaxID=151549 RepID=A0A4C1YRS4_EUMVA|nr:hypothetical protein EVAR_90248_1 [Eumeta japonica]
MVATYEAVSSAFVRLSIRNDDGLLDVAIDGEMLPQALVRGVIGQTADEEFGPGRILLAGQRAQGQQPLGLGLEPARHQHSLHALRRDGTIYELTLDGSTPRMTLITFFGSQWFQYVHTRRELVADWRRWRCAAAVHVAGGRQAGAPHLILVPAPSATLCLGGVRGAARCTPRPRPRCVCCTLVTLTADLSTTDNETSFTYTSNEKFCKSQNPIWARHLEIMDDIRVIKITINWTPQKKRLRGRSGKLCKDCVEQNLKSMGRKKFWRRKDRAKWEKVVEEAKIHKRFTERGRKIPQYICPTYRWKDSLKQDVNCCNRDHDEFIQQLASRWHWLYRRYCACVIPLFTRNLVTHACLEFRRWGTSSLYLLHGMTLRSSYESRRAAPKSDEHEARGRPTAGRRRDEISPSRRRRRIRLAVQSQRDRDRRECSIAVPDMEAKLPCSMNSYSVVGSTHACAEAAVPLAHPHGAPHPFVCDEKKIDRRIYRN